MCILKDISLHIGRKMLMFYVPNSLWCMCATYRRENAPWHFILCIAADSWYGRREFSSIIIILWKNIYWNRYWWKPSQRLSKEEHYSRNKRLRQNANSHTASLAENKANNRCPDLDSGMKEGEEMANMQCN